MRSRLVIALLACLALAGFASVANAASASKPPLKQQIEKGLAQAAGKVSRQNHYGWTEVVNCSDPVAGVYTCIGTARNKRSKIVAVASFHVTTASDGDGGVTWTATSTWILGGTVAKNHYS